MPELALWFLVAMVSVGLFWAFWQIAFKGGDRRKSNLGNENFRP